MEIIKLQRTPAVGRSAEALLAGATALGIVWGRPHLALPAATEIHADALERAPGTRELLPGQGRLVAVAALVGSAFGQDRRPDRPAEPASVGRSPRRSAFPCAGR